MGESPKGFVFYGIPLPVDEYGEQQETPWEKYEADDWFASKHGLHQPKDPGIGAPAGSLFAFKEAYSTYYDAKKALLEQQPCGIEFAGYQEFEVEVVVVKESHVEVEWSDVKPFSTEVKPEWDEQLRAYCKDMGIEWVQPGWHVASRLF